MIQPVIAARSLAWFWAGAIGLGAGGAAALQLAGPPAQRPVAAAAATLPDAPPAPDLPQPTPAFTVTSAATTGDPAAAAGPQDPTVAWPAAPSHHPAAPRAPDHVAAHAAGPRVTPAPAVRTASARATHTLPPAEIERHLLSRYAARAKTRLATPPGTGSASIPIQQADSRQGALPPLPPLAPAGRWAGGYGPPGYGYGYGYGYAPYYPPIRSYRSGYGGGWSYPD